MRQASTDQQHPFANNRLGRHVLRYRRRMLRSGRQANDLWWWSDASRMDGLRQWKYMFVGNVRSALQRGEAKFSELFLETEGHRHI